MSRRSSEKGFTLLEVLVALAILAGALTTLVVSFNYHLSISVRDKEETTALLLGRALLDEPDFMKGTATEGTFAPDYPEITWKRSTSSTEFNGLQRNLLTVSWQDGKRSMQLVLYARK